MPENEIRITWYGTASVRITAGDSQLLIDPFFPLPDSKIKLARNAFDGCSRILITHGHFDHIGSIREIVRSDTAVYCTKAPYQSLRRKGVRKENLRLIRAGSVFSAGDFTITAYQGSHIKLTLRDGLKAVFCRRARQNRKGLLTKFLKFTSCREKKEALCYVAEVYGRRILILGSLALAEHIRYPAGADLAMFPYQGSEQIFDIAKRIYEQLRPQAVLLTHFDDTFPPFSQEIDTSEIEQYLSRYTKVIKLRQGDSFTLPNTASISSHTGGQP
ncbi:MAG: MBL fold metallo-hydrolase [Oscillospiraceae bacterium]|nr:MBL fold metallo-hydrolase [Oscillospiraceae bacterium]MCR5306810.1 MBL fold metallo-hydrolase [Oscillospiraceae bacterium]